jgi:hypothetical protein
MENEQTDWDKPQLFINLDKVMNATQYPAVIRLAAMTVKTAGYLHPGEFFRTMSDRDLSILTQICDDMLVELLSDAQQKAVVEPLLVLSCVLALGEGAGEIDEQRAQRHLQSTMIFVALEGLFRKGVIELNHPNISYLEDTPELAKLKGAP